MSKQALITGSVGFIGTHFWRQLVDLDYGIFGCDTRHLYAPRDCRKVFREDNDQYDLVIHAAANVGGRENLEHKQLWVAENFEIDAVMFQWALRTKPKHVVYFSSSAVYPIDLQAKHYQGPLKEDDADGIYGPPDGTYGLAKLVGEHQANLLQQAGINVHIVRPFSGYGEDQSTDYPFPNLVRQVRNHAPVVEVWGDGTQIRDWIHVDDVVGATMFMVHNNIPGPVNLGTGIPTDFLTLVRKMGYQGDIVPRPDKPTGVQYRLADPTRLHEFYVPKISLEEGIARSLK